MANEIQNNPVAAKAGYEAPTVSVIGEFGVVTQHTSKGSKSDMFFASGTPITEILSNLS